MSTFHVTVKLQLRIYTQIWWWVYL